MAMWTFSFILAVGMLLLVVIVFGRRVFPGTRLTVERVRCPVRNTNVEVGFVEAVWDWRRIDVESCSAFAPPTAVSCDKRCLQLAGPTPKWQSPAGPLY